jgi:hypothetical protein
MLAVIAVIQRVVGVRVSAREAEGAA